MSLPGASGSSSSRPSRTVPQADTITRNALRYTISAREYELLHQYLISRSAALRKRAPEPKQARGHTNSSEDDYNAATIRVTLRVFLATLSGLKLWDFLLDKLVTKGQQAKSKTPLLRSTNFRLSLSISSILFFHRILHRFFNRLRESLRTEDARPFRRRNPRIARALTSRLAPAVGASVAGVFLAVAPADQTRITITIYVLSRALEFFYNHLEDRGHFKNRPWWFGSWLMMPVAFGQLLHACVIDRDCFPASYGNFILKRSPMYIQQRPTEHPAHLPWPETFDIVDSLAEVSRLRWPSFVPPILFPNAKTLPSGVRKIAPVVDPAHPAIKHLSCAILHPNDPSCLRTYVMYYVKAFPRMARFWGIVYSAFALLRFRSFKTDPLASLNKLATQVLRTSFFITSAIGTAWGSICFLQTILPRNLLPTGRWFLSGFIAGLWAFLERGSGRGNFLYSARMSADSLWKVGKKRGWWKGIKNGDVLLFTACLMLMDGVYERNPRAVSGGVLRKGFGVLRGEGWVDRVAEADKKSREIQPPGSHREAERSKDV